MLLNLVLYWTNKVEILHISSSSVRMRKNTDRKNSEYGRFSRSVMHQGAFRTHAYN